MSALADGLELNVSSAELRKRMIQTAAPDGVEFKSGVVSSNSFFTTLQQFAFSVVEEFKNADSYQEFEAAVVQYANEVSSASAEQQARAIAYRVAPYVWSEFDPSKRQSVRSRKGILMDEMNGKTLAERQAEGARFVSADRKSRSIRRGVSAVLTLKSEGKPVTQAAVAASSAMALRTVKTHWQAIRAAAETAKNSSATDGARRCIDKKQIANGQPKKNQSTSTLWQSIRTQREAIAAVTASMEDTWQPTSTEIDADANSWDSPTEPHDTSDVHNAWDGWGDPPTPPPPLASTPLADLPVGTALYVDIPF